MSSGGTIINARRKGGGHALKMLDGFDNPGFSVALVKIDNHWMVMR